VFFINIDQHQLYVIEADGVELEPYPLDVLMVAVAQRYSILVTAKSETTTNYAMSVMQSPDMSVLLIPCATGYRTNRVCRYDSVPDTLVLNNTLQIVYNADNAPAGDVTFDAIETLDDSKFVPVLKRAMAPADIEYELNVYFDVRVHFLLYSELILIYQSQTYDDGTNRASCK
jgi:iron transport multicopper oxidase